MDPGGADDWLVVLVSVVSGWHTPVCVDYSDLRYWLWCPYSVLFTI